MGSEFLPVSYTDSLETEGGEERAGGQGRSPLILSPPEVPLWGSAVSISQFPLTSSLVFVRIRFLRSKQP